MPSVGDRVVVRVRDRSSSRVLMKYEGVTGTVKSIEGPYVIVSPDPQCVTRERPSYLKEWSFDEHLFDVQLEHSPADILPDRDWS